MAALSSHLASLTYGGNTSSAMGSVGVSTSMSPVEATEIGDLQRKFIPGQGTATVQMELYYDQGDAVCAALETAANTNAVAAACTVTLMTGMTYAGNVLVTEFSPTASIGDIIRANVTLQFTGTRTIA